MNLNLADFQGRFPATQWTVLGNTWTLRDTDQGATRVPLVMLPGAGGTGDTFYRAIDTLRERRRVISVSYPAVDDVNDLASGLLVVLAKAGIDQFDLFGSSLGGYLAQMCALREPSRVRRVMFANTFYDATWLQRKVPRDALLAKPADEHLAATLTQLRALPDDTAEKADFKRTMLHLVGTDQTAEMAKAALLAVLGADPLPKVDFPASKVAVLDVEDDPVVDAPTRSAMRVRYAGAAQFRLGTGGHYPALLNPDEFRAALLEHFRSE
jgi:pimeloyl-ACP methyl ester carboxylesterase